MPTALAHQKGAIGASDAELLSEGFKNNFLYLLYNKMAALAWVRGNFVRVRRAVAIVPMERFLRVRGRHLHMSNGAVCQCLGGLLVGIVKQMSWSRLCDVNNVRLWLINQDLLPIIFLSPVVMMKLYTRPGWNCNPDLWCNISFSSGTFCIDL